MKALALFTGALYGSAVAAASPLALALGSGTDSAAPGPEPLLARQARPPPDEDAPARNLEAVRRAAGPNVQLKPGSSYYLMMCKPASRFLAENPGSDEAFKWVMARTRNAENPYGCAHVGLIIGTYQTKGGGCFGCTGATVEGFEGKYMHTRLDEDVTPMRWKQNFDAKKPAVRWEYTRLETVFWGGEIQGGKKVDMKAVEKTLAEIGAQWVEQAGSRYTADTNCMIYYYILVDALHTMAL